MRVSIKRAIQDALPVELRKRVCQITGHDPSPEVVVLDASRHWVLARSLADLNPDGYLATSRSIIESLHTSVHRDFRKRILQSEKSWPGVLRKPPINLQTTATVLKSLQTLGLFAIVLCETHDEWFSFHCRIEEVANDYTKLLGFDGAGRWESRAKRWDISAITQIRFGSRYLNLYQKHASTTRNT